MNPIDGIDAFGAAGESGEANALGSSGEGDFLRAVADTFAGQVAGQQSVLQGQGLATTGFLPINIANGRPFFGVNALILGSSGFTDPRWMTANFAESQRFGIDSHAHAMTLMSWQAGRHTGTHRRLILAQVINAAQVDGVVAAVSAPVIDEATVGRLIGRAEQALPGLVASREIAADAKVVTAIASAMAAYVVAARLGLPAPVRSVSASTVTAVRDDPTCLLRGATLGHRFANSLIGDLPEAGAGPLPEQARGPFDGPDGAASGAVRSGGRSADGSLGGTVWPATLTIDVKAQFRQALEALGLIIDGDPVMDGSRQRVAVQRGDGKHPRNLDGAYIGYLDGRPAGYIKNWFTGQERRWKADSPLTDEHRRSIMAEASANRSRAERARRERYDHHARRSAQYLALLPAARADHPYLVRKQITVSSGLRQDRRGNLVLPFQDIDGRVRGFQRIAANGFKRIKKNVQKKGAFHLIGAVDGSNAPECLLLTEGYATGKSVHEITGRPVVVALDAYNLSAVAKVLRSRYPGTALVIAADDDRHQSPNVGREQALKAAALAQALVVLPGEVPGSRPGQDFNDLVCAGLGHAVGALLRQRAEAVRRSGVGAEPETRSADSEHENNSRRRGAVVRR